MKNKRILKRIAIMLSIILLIIDVFIYINMKSSWLEISTNNHQYENASLIMTSLFKYGALIWGILLILMVWLEYLLVSLFIKIYNKFDALKRLFLCLLTLVPIVIILILFVKIILLIITILI